MNRIDQKMPPRLRKEANVPLIFLSVYHHAASPRRLDGSHTVTPIAAIVYESSSLSECRSGKLGAAEQTRPGAWRIL